MSFDELQFIVLNKRTGTAKNGKTYYQIKLGSNIGLSADVFVKKEIFETVSIFEVVTQFVRIYFTNNKLSFNLVI